ncbi:MAG: DUF2059 domain-containing protein [Chitinispirillales bacterium]|jgi:hypothetical protein|nr:DUF2059 domain-containing protein [Chitinispirillales bacterium]
MKISLLNKTRRLCLYAVIPVLLASSNVFSQTIESDILRLLELSGGAEMANQMVDALTQQFQQLLPTAMPATFWDGIKAKVNSGEFLQLSIPVYKKYYTHDEIKELIKFYETPIGRKMAQVSPAMAQEMMVIGQRWGEKVGAELMNEIMRSGGGR